MSHWNETIWKFTTYTSYIIVFSSTCLNYLIVVLRKKTKGRSHISCQMSPWGKFSFFFLVTKHRREGGGNVKPILQFVMSFFVYYYFYFLFSFFYDGNCVLFFPYCNKIVRNFFLLYDVWLIFFSSVLLQTREKKLFCNLLLFCYFIY